VNAGAARRPDDEDDRIPLPRARRGSLVLIADDTPDVRELYGLHLSHVGFSVELAADGFAAVDAAIRLRPDVIVMDLSMPGLDGIAATQHLKSHRHTRHIPVILLTGYPYRAIQQRALERGVDVFLTKPCLPEDLEGHVRRVLQRGPG
jgi:CheY-like chemotaxis protein